MAGGTISVFGLSAAGHLAQPVTSEGWNNLISGYRRCPRSDSWTPFPRETFTQGLLTGEAGGLRPTWRHKVHSLDVDLLSLCLILLLPWGLSLLPDRPTQPSPVSFFQTIATNLNLTDCWTCHPPHTHTHVTLLTGPLFPLLLSASHPWT